MVQVSAISELSTEAKEWAVQGRLSRLWFSRHPFNDTPMRQDLILIDNESNDIWVQIPLKLIPIFKDKVVVQKFYKFQNFRVLMTPSEYRPISNKLIIEFTASTSVEEVGDLSDIPKHMFNFIEEKDIHYRVEQRADLFDTIGYLVNHTNLERRAVQNRTTDIKNVYLRLKEGVVVRVTFWGRLAVEVHEMLKAYINKPVVLLISSLYVKKFKDETYFQNTSITQVHLDIPETKCFIDRSESSAQTTPIKPPVFSDPTAPRIPKITLNALDTLKRDDDNLGHFYKVLCTVTKVVDGWCYIGRPAEHCRRKVEPDADQYYYGHCQKTVPYIAARFRIQLKVADNTGASNFVIMEKEVSRYFNTNAHPLFEMNKRNYKDPPEILRDMVGKSFTFLIELNNNNMRRLNSEYKIYEIKDKPTYQHDVKESSMDLSSGRTSSQSLHRCVIGLGSSPNTNKTAIVPEMTPPPRIQLQLHQKLSMMLRKKITWLMSRWVKWMNWMMIVSL